MNVVAVTPVAARHVKSVVVVAVAVMMMKHCDRQRIVSKKFDKYAEKLSMGQTCYFIIYRLQQFTARQGESGKRHDRSN